MLELYHNDMSVCAQKVRMVLAEKNLDWQGPNLNLRAGDQFKKEFLALNPKAVVPVIVHDGRVITESNAIVQYLDESFEQPRLMPEDAFGRAMVRKWLLWLDAGFHVQIAFISVALAFRHQLLEIHTTPQALEKHLSGIPDLGIRLAVRDLVANGPNSAFFRISVQAYDMLLNDIENTLGKTAWLVGDCKSLADIAYVPYLTRLEHLQLGQWWSQRPRLTAWLERIKLTKGYREGIVDWLNTGYLSLMQERGRNSWRRVQVIIKTEF